MGGPGSGRRPRSVEREMEEEGTWAKGRSQAKGKDGLMHPKGVKMGAVGSEEFERNTRYIKFQRALRKLKKIDTTDTDAIDERFDEFLDLCEEYGCRPLPTAFALSLGLAPQTLTRLLRGSLVWDSWPVESLEKVEELYTVLESSAEMELVDNHNRNAAQQIFFMKNRFGWRDIHEAHTVRLDQTKKLPSAEEIAAKYALQVGAVVEEGQAALPPEQPSD